MRRDTWETKQSSCQPTHLCVYSGRMGCCPCSAAIGPCNRGKQHNINIGERRDGLVEVLQGVENGDQVVVAGLQRVQHNAPVKVAGKPLPARESALKAGDVPAPGAVSTNQPK